MLEIRQGSEIIGNVIAGLGSDTLRLGGVGAEIFDLAGIDTGANTQQYRQFEEFEISGGVWTLTNTTTAAFTVTGGTLIGTPTLGGLIVDDGTIAPGNSIGTLNVNGNIVFNAGSAYQVEIDNAGQTDLIAATGTATIASTGTTLDILGAASDYPDTSPTYTILTATGGVTGQFATVQDNLPDLDFTATYNPNSVQLTYVKATSKSAPELDFSPKEILPSSLGSAMANGQLFASKLGRRASLHESHGWTRAGSDLIDDALGYTTARATQARETLGGVELPEQIYAADQPASPMQAFVDPNLWASWVASQGSIIKVSAAGATPGWDATSGGIAFGLERRFDSIFDMGMPFVAGVAGGYSVSDVSSGASRANIKSYEVGTYGATQIGGLRLSQAVTFSWQDYSLIRPLTLGGGGAATALGDTIGYVLTGGFEGFYDVVDRLGLGAIGNGTHEATASLFDGVAFGPVATVDTVFGRMNGFTETGAGVLNLTVASTTSSETITGLGVAARIERPMGEGQIALNGRIAWEHVFGDRSITTDSTIGFAGAAFTTTSAPIAADRVAISIGTAIEFSDTVSAHARYDGRFAGGDTDHRASIGFKVTF